MRIYCSRRRDGDVRHTRAPHIRKRAYMRGYMVRDLVWVRARRRLKIQPGRGMYHRGTYAENRGPHAEWGEEEGRSLAGSNQDLRFIIYNAQERARARVRRRTLSFTSTSLFSPLSLSLSRTRSLSRFFLSAPYTSGFLRFLSLSLSLFHLHVFLFPPLPSCSSLLLHFSLFLSFVYSYARGRFIGPPSLSAGVEVYYRASD